MALQDAGERLRDGRRGFGFHRSRNQEQMIMEEKNETKQEAKSPLAATVGLLLSVIVAAGLGWFARTIYQNSLDAKAQAQAVADAAAAAQVRPVTVETVKATMKATPSGMSMRPSMPLR